MNMNKGSVILVVAKETLKTRTSADEADGISPTHNGSQAMTPTQEQLGPALETAQEKAQSIENESDKEYNHVCSHPEYRVKSQRVISPTTTEVEDDEG